MPVSTLGLTVEQKIDGTYLTIYLPDGSYSEVGPLVQGSMVGTIKAPPSAAKPGTKKRRRRSMKQEEEIAARQGARRVRGSGSVAGHKGDVRKPGMLRLEAKYTDKKSFRLEQTELAKIRSECTNLEVPCFEVHFVEPKTQRAYDRWVVVDARYFQHMEYTPPYATTHDR